MGNLTARLMKRLGRYKLLVAILVLGVIGAGAAGSVAYAAHNCYSTVIWGRRDCYNYINGQRYKNTIPTFNNNFFVNRNQYSRSFTAPLFIATMEDRLKNGNTQDRISATVMINIMLGKKGAEFNGSKTAAVNYANDHLDEWKALVNDYESKGLIQWDRNWCSGGQYENTSYDAQQVGRNTPGDVDDVWHYTEDPECIRVMQFNRPAGQPGQPFRIQYGCGNPIGEADLKSPATGDINPPTPATPQDPPGYNNGDSNTYSSCTVVSGHAFDPSNASYQVPVTVTYTIGGTVVGTDTSIRASTTGAHLWTANTPAAVRGSPDQVTVSAVGRAADGSTYTLTNSPITIGPCLKAQPACSGATVAPNALDPNTPFTVTANVHYGSDAEAAAVMSRGDTRFFVNVNGPGLNFAQTYAPAQITRTGSSLTVTTQQMGPTGQTGKYVIGYGVNGSFGAIQCGSANSSDPSPPTFYVTGKPYFSVKNGDISAGAGMSIGGTECAASGVAANQNAGVVSWNRGTSGGYAGAGTQQGALALGLLQGFATAQGSSGQPTGASFGNTGGTSSQVNVAGGVYGGQFGGIGCTGDYFKDVDPAKIQGSQTLGATSVPNCNGSNAAACKVVRYIEGDLYINGDVTFSGSYASAAQIPSFSVVVRGNIYIAPGVKRLDGFYIAQASGPSATNGVIYTCATSPSIAAGLNANLGTTCNNDLTVNGAFVARQVWLLRTAGSVSGTPAETFNYSPEAWLSTPYGNGLTQGKTDDYDSITGLPPVL